MLFTRKLRQFNKVAANSDEVIVFCALTSSPIQSQYLEASKNIPSDFTIKDSEQEVTIYGKTAIVRARYALTIGEQVLNLRYTTTFLKRGGK